MPLCLCVCVCAREIGSALTGRVSVSSALCRRCSWLTPSSFLRNATDAAHFGPTYCTGFCPTAWQMTPPQVSVWVSLPVPVRVRRLQLRLRFGFRFLARAGPGWGHLVFKRLSTRPVQRIQSRVLLCFALFCCFLRRALSSISATHSLLGAFSCRLRLRLRSLTRSLRPLRLIYRLKTVCLLRCHLNLFSAFSMCYRAIVLSINLTCATEMPIKLEFLLIRHRFELIWFA